MLTGVLDHLLEAFWRLPPVVSGGIAGLFAGPLGVYLLNWWRTRPRFRARVLEEYWRDGTVKLEVENLGADASLKPDIIMTDYTMKGQRRSFLFRIEDECKFPRHQRRVIFAMVQGPGIGMHRTEVSKATLDALQFAWFRTYRIDPTRGRRVRVRLRSGFGVQLGCLQFTYELLRFRLFGKVKDEYPDPMRVDP